MCMCVCVCVQCRHLITSFDSQATWCIGVSGLCFALLFMFVCTNMKALADVRLTAAGIECTVCMYVCMYICRFVLKYFAIRRQVLPIK